MKKRVLVILNDIKRAQEHEWFVKYINRDLFTIEFVLINGTGSEMEKYLADASVKFYHFSYRSKTDIPGLVFRIYRLLRSKKYDIVHTHLFESSLIGLTAAKLAGVPKRIMTRHYSDYHHVWFPSAVKYDRYMNYLATDIVAISLNVAGILKINEGVPEGKIKLIHHGIDMSEYTEGAVSDDRIELIRAKYQLKGVYPVVGTISRFTELKGLQYLIPAFNRVLENHKEAVLVMANASGDYTDQINELLKQIPDRNQRKIVFENDIAALYKVFDCFVHIPINATAEAFGQTYIESLASKVPSVFTLSGIAPEFIVDNENSFVVDYCNPGEVFEKLSYIIANPKKLENIKETGYRVVSENFNIQLKIEKLEKLYLSVL